MATVNVINWKKEKVGTVDLDPSVFEAEFNKDLLYEVVRWQLASRRQGTHMTKTKGLVRGGGKKPFKQKGTGGARQGSSRSILMPGGGTAFGPTPRDYSYALPKKMRRGALAVALSHLLREGKLFVIDSIKSEGKTGEFSKRMKAFGLEKAVVLDSKADALVQRAAKNLKTIKYSGVEGLNVYDLLKANAIVLTKESVSDIVGKCKVEKAI